MTLKTAANLWMTLLALTACSAPVTPGAPMLRDETTKASPKPSLRDTAPTPPPPADREEPTACAADQERESDECFDRCEPSQAGRDAGVVVVESPTSALVIIDGCAAGRAPLERLLPSGLHDVEVMHEGVSRWHDSVSVEPMTPTTIEVDAP